MKTRVIILIMKPKIFVITIKIVEKNNTNIHKKVKNTHSNNNSNQNIVDKNYVKSSKDRIISNPSEDLPKTQKSREAPKKEKKYFRVVKTCGKFFGRKKLKIRPSSGLVGVLLNSQTLSGVGKEKRGGINEGGRKVNKDFGSEGQEMQKYSAKGQKIDNVVQEICAKGRERCSKDQEICIKCQQVWTKLQQIIRENQRLQIMKLKQTLQNSQMQQIQKCKKIAFDKY